MYLFRFFDLEFEVWVEMSEENVKRCLYPLLSRAFSQIGAAVSGEGFFIVRNLGPSSINRLWNVAYNAWWVVRFIFYV